MTYVAYKNAFFREMQVWSHYYTVVSYQALFRLSVYKIPAVYLSDAKNVCFLQDTRLWFHDILVSSQANGTKSTSILTHVRNEVDLVLLACEDGIRYPNIVPVQPP